MPITATCSNCGKSYQAPDALAGKRVRCKDCGQTFLIEPPEMLPDEPPDLSGIDESFSSGIVDSPAGLPAAASGSWRKAAEKTIARDPGVQEMDLAGASVAMRPNLRFRFNGAKEIDQYLPYVLLLAGVIFTPLFMVNWANHAPGIGVSQGVLLLLCYFLAIGPCVTAAMRFAGQNVGYELPKQPLLRSFASFVPALILTLVIWKSGGGDFGSFALGLGVGGVLSMAVVWLLFRLFPNELPLTGLFALTGLLAGTALSIAVLFVVNLVVLSIVNNAGLQASLTESPVAHGMPWEVTKPATEPEPTTPTVVAKTPTNTTPKPPVNTGGADPALRALIAKLDLTGAGTPDLADTFPVIRTTPPPNVNAADLALRMLVAAPVDPGFDSIVRPSSGGPALGVVRGDRLDLTSMKSWLPAKSFTGWGSNAFGGVVISPDASRTAEVKRLTRLQIVVTDRDAPTAKKLIDLDPTGDPVLVGFVDPNRLVIRRTSSASPGELAYEVISLDAVSGTSPRRAATLALRASESAALQIAPDATNAVQLLPDRSGIVAAGRDPSSGGDAVLGLWAWGSDVPVKRWTMPVDSGFNVKPAGMAIDATASKVAVLFTLEGSTDLLLQIYDRNAAQGTGPREVPLIGVADLKPARWEDRYPPAVWVSDSTILLYGNTLVDAAAGTVRPIRLAAGEVVGQLPSNGPVVPLILMEGSSRRLALAIVNPDAGK
jgi:hypothetical protein